MVQREVCDIFAVVGERRKVKGERLEAMNIETFYFNPYRECTYLLINDQQQAVIIDAGMYETREQQRFAQYIQSHQLTPIALLITHAHPEDRKSVV